MQPFNRDLKLNVSACLSFRCIILLLMGIMSTRSYITFMKYVLIDECNPNIEYNNVHRCMNIAMITLALDMYNINLL